VRKLRSGLTRVVSTYTYAVPLSTTSVPTPSKHRHPVTTITRKNTTQCPEVVSTYTYAVLLPLQSIPPLVVEEPGLLVVEIWQKHGVMTTTWNWVMQSNQLIQHQRFREQIPPSHTLGSIPSEHGAFALGKAAQSCATHGEANRWGSRIYGELVSSSHVVPNPQSLSFALTALGLLR
jgi:hypothetical protein